MKRTILFLALATLLLPALKLNAQVGFHAGYAPQTLAVKGPAVADRESASTFYHGFFGGIHYNFDIVGDLGFVPALQIRMNSASGNDSQYETQDWQFGMDIPLLLSYDFDLGHDVGLGLFAGPTLSYGISFTRKYKDLTTHAAHHSVNRYGDNLPEQNQNLALRRFEIGAAGGAFVEYRDFMLFFGYRFGFNDLDRVADQTTKPRGFFVGVGIN